MHLRASVREMPLQLTDQRPRAAARVTLYCAVALVAIIVGGCARGGPGSSGPIVHPSGDGLVLRVETSGGLLPPDTIFSQAPQLSLYGDGRVVVPGAIDMIYPGPALAPLLTTRLNEPGVQAVLHEVVATGLFSTSQSFQEAAGFVSDAGTTEFTLHADGRDVTVSVYGLGTIDLSNPPAGMSTEALSAYKALTDLSQKLNMLGSWLPASAWTDRTSRPYVPEAFRLLVRNADSDPPDQSGIANQLVPWPEAGDPATFGEPATQPAGARCGVVHGAEAATWYDVMRGANLLTRFTFGGQRYQVTARSLLPDEPQICTAA